MPIVSRWGIRLAMLYLILGMAGWVISVANQTGYIEGTWWALRPVSIHWITVGWLTQLIFCVMYWMFPIVSRQAPYGKQWITILGLVLLNIGLLLRAIFEIGLSRGMATSVGWGLVGSAVLQWLAVSLLVIAMWGRVRPRGGR